MVDSADLGYAHSSGYVAELRDVLERVAADGRLRALDPDTVASPGTLNAVLRAAGAAVAATDAVIDGEVANAFCAVRPPGHHATREPGDGVLLLQQRRGRRAPRARRARPRARRDHRLRRPPRQRHRGHLSPATSAS